MLCPTHKTPMTQLLTSWVCDVCQPPAGIEPVASEKLQPDLARKQMAEAIKKVLSYPVTGPSHAPGMSPTVQCSDGYTWQLWRRNTSAFRVPPHFSLYYFDHSAVPGKVDRVKYTSSLIYRLDGSDGTTGQLTVLKDKFSPNGLANSKVGVTPSLYQELEQAACYAMYNFNRGTEQLVFFLAR